mmetsp:Transcript_27899/g.46893  ORF Transcript_27899/g.46893 Transcript_27899/m.46893 type:complete len:216 (+) Transcript_27899:245-892(+)
MLLVMRFTSDCPSTILAKMPWLICVREDSTSAPPSPLRDASCDATKRLANSRRSPGVSGSVPVRNPSSANCETISSASAHTFSVVTFTTWLSWKLATIVFAKLSTVSAEGLDIFATATKVVHSCLRTRSSPASALVVRAQSAPAASREALHAQVAVHVVSNMVHVSDKTLPVLSVYTHSPRPEHTAVELDGHSRGGAAHRPFSLQNPSKQKASPP